ncbi:MAG: Crossover junction endodeoxyribonuclease RuvC [Parcubacteria group bacterium GW2011_GWA2_51_10]|nr:MAG: Crossover junction endodeoxyribonuclease RuvC [Parcubacteria group bacterium GW2011_GWA2_51_10]
MRILAIDPGYGRCGMAILEREDRKDILVYSGCLETDAKVDFPLRLAAVAAECSRLIEKYAPAALAIEKLYFSANKKTAMRVSEVRGALIGSAAERGIPVFEYTPGEIKSATAGSGSADKTQIAKMLHALVKIEKKIKYDDEYDAIAVGVTHLARHRT